MHRTACKPYLVRDSGVRGGQPTRQGTRWPVEVVLELPAGGWASDAIRENDPNRTDGRIRAVLVDGVETVGANRFKTSRYR